MQDLYNRIVQTADTGEAVGGEYEIDGDLVFIGIVGIKIAGLKLRQLNPKTDRRTLFFLRCEKVQIDGLEIDVGSSPSVGHMGEGGGLWIDGGQWHQVKNVTVTGDGKLSYIAIHNTLNSHYTNLRVQLGDWQDPSANNDVQQGIWFNKTTDCTLVLPNVKGRGLKFTRAIVGGGNVRLRASDFVIADTDQGFDLTGDGGNIECVVEHGKVSNCLTWPVKLANSAVRCKVSDVTAENSGAFVASGPSQPDQAHKTQDCEFTRCKAVNPRGWGFRVMTSLFEHSYPRGIKFIDCEGTFHSELPGNELIRCVGHSEGFPIATPVATPPSPIRKSFPMAAILAVLAVLGLLAILII